METKLARIAQIARENPTEKFTSLVHLIQAESLKQCHRTMDGSKATGVDQVTKAEYEANLEENVRNLVSRMKQQSYKPQPVRRSYIPKAGSNKKRPLGIPSYEDKLVQGVMAQILNAIYEADFLNCSYGFRPGRGCHDALREVTRLIETRRVNYIVDADIKGFFDHVSHEWLLKFLALRIGDPNMLGLITRFLKAGIMEDGRVLASPEGTPQGGIVSPVLANVYLHYVLDLWFQKRVQRQSRGEAYLVRYADDFICCFEYEEDARAFYAGLVERLGKFSLELAEDKTRIIAFGKRAEENKDGEGPNTFDFLGFTHYGGKSRHGKFRVKRRTSRKKFRASLLRAKEWLRRNRCMPVRELMPLLRMKLTGYDRYYGITDNYQMLANYHRQVKRLLFKWLNRRSQKRSFDWETFETKFLVITPLPQPRIYVNIYGTRTATA